MPAEIKPGDIVIAIGAFEPCRVIRSKVFPSGTKYEIREKCGKTWHKMAEELKVLTKSLENGL